MANVVDWRKMDIRNAVAMQAAVSDGQFAWFSHFYYNCLIQVQIDNNKIIKVEPFIKEELDVFALHKGVVRYKNKIYFYPNRGKGLNVVDIVSGEQRYISLKEHLIEEDRCKFSNAILRDHQLWLIPQDYKQELVMVDLENEQITTMFWWKEEMNKCRFQENEVFLNAEQARDSLFISVRGKNYFLKCSLEEKTIKQVTIEKESLQIQRIFVNADLIWCICCDSTDIYIVSYEGKIIKHLSIQENSKEFAPYSTIINREDKMIVIPRLTRDLLVYNRTGKLIKEIVLSYYKEIKYPAKTICNYATEIMDNSLLIYPNYDGVVRKLNLSTYELLEYRFNGTDIFHKYYYENILPLYMKRVYKGKKILTESEDSALLKDYIYYIEKDSASDSFLNSERIMVENNDSCAKRIMEKIFEK